MQAQITHNGSSYTIDLSHPLDISMPMRSGLEAARAWYVDPIRIEPVMNDRFIGEVKLGGFVNFRNIAFNPHGNGTHTECVGHISEEAYSINDTLDRHFFRALVVTIEPEQQGEDRIITKAQIEQALGDKRPEAIILRTLPNSEDKYTKLYSGANPAYMEPAVASHIVEAGIDHLLLDLPSLDREEDGGKLLAHRAFWEYPENTQAHRTITELIYVPNSVADGWYFLDLSFAPFENDASPSKPILYRILS